MMQSTIKYIPRSLTTSNMLNYDPLNVLPPTSYEEFLYQIEQPEAITVAASFNGYLQYY